MMSEVVKAGEIEMWHVPGTENPADMFTKILTPGTHTSLAAVMMGETAAVHETAGDVVKATARDFK